MGMDKPKICYCWRTPTKINSFLCLVCKLAKYWVVLGRVDGELVCPYFCWKEYDDDTRY